MAFFDTSFGIDFRENHLILMFLKKSFGRVRLIDFGVYPILQDNKKEERDSQIIGVLNTFISKHQINKGRVHLSIPREKVVARFISLPIAVKENLRRVMEYEISKYTPFEKEEIYFDFQVVKQEREWIHLFAVFMKKVELDHYLNLLKKIGIQPLSVQIPSISALNLFLYHRKSQSNGATILIDTTESFFEINLIQGRSDWKESFFIPSSLMENESRWMNTLKQSGLNTDTYPKASFYIYGLGAVEKTIQSLRSFHSIKHILFPPLNRIIFNQPLSKPYSIYGSIGVALRGLVKTSLSINLLPMERRKKVRQIGKPIFISLVVLASILGLIWGMGIFFQYRNELKTVTAEIKKRRPEVEAVERLQRQKGELDQEILELQKIRSEEISKIEILEELTQVLPQTAWIWNLKYNGKEIEISGFADSASDLIPILERSQLFEKVEFVAPVTKERQMKMEGDKERERFRLKARLEGRKTGS